MPLTKDLWVASPEAGIRFDNAPIPGGALVPRSIVLWEKKLLPSLSTDTQGIGQDDGQLDPPGPGAGFGSVLAGSKHSGRPLTPLAADPFFGSRDSESANSRASNCCWACMIA